VGGHLGSGTNIIVNMHTVVCIVVDWFDLAVCDTSTNNRPNDGMQMRTETSQDQAMLAYL